MEAGETMEGAGDRSPVSRNISFKSHIGALILIHKQGRQATVARPDASDSRTSSELEVNRPARWLAQR